MNRLSHKILFAGCARDCAQHLPAVLDNVRRLAERVAEPAFLFVENDSVDSTLAQLEAFCKVYPSARVLNLSGIGRHIEQRTVRLAMARNALMATLKSWPEVAQHSHLMLLDMDDVNTQPWDLDTITEALAWMAQRPQVGGIFPNQSGPYYDLWALREPQRCPGDVWEEILMQSVATGKSDHDAAAYVMDHRAFSLPAEAGPLQVESAFGGFGIYRLDACLRNPAPYCGEGVQVWQQGQETRIARWQRCEHVNFNLGLRRLGYDLFVLPQIINADSSTWGYQPSAFRSMLF